MSVILDALRRRKSSAAESSARGIPAGLGLSSAVSTVSRQRGQRLKVIAIVAFVVLIGVWVNLQLNSRRAATDVPAARPAPPPVVVSHPNPDTPIPTPELRTTSPEPQPPSRDLRIPLREPRIARPEPRVDHFALALRYQNLGDFDRAREQYLAVLAADASNLETHNNLGLLYHGRGMTSDAMEQFNRAIQINPRYTKARSNLAVVLTSAGRLAEARAELRTALDVDPQNADLLVNMALVEKADGHGEQAIEILLRAVATSPVHGAAHYNLAVLYDERGLLALAVDHYNAFLKNAGPERGALLGDVQRRVRDIEPRLHTATN